MIVHLGDAGRVVDGEKSNALQAARVGLKAKNVGGEADAVDLFRHVIDLHVDVAGAGRRDLMVVDTLVNGANQVRRSAARAIAEFEAELARRVGLGAAGNVHAIGDVDEDDLVSGSGLVGGTVGDGAGEGLGCGGGQGEREERGYENGLFEIGQKNSLRIRSSAHNVSEPQVKLLL